MQILFLLGWVLLLGAFSAAASEPFIMVSSSGRGITRSILTPAYDLWYTLAPGNLVISKIQIEKISPMLWDPVLINFLQLPAWLILGVPGVFLAWFYRPNRVMTPEIAEEYERQKQSLFFIDELNREAMLDENYDPEQDDRSPVHELFDLEQSEDEDLRNSVFADDAPADFTTLEELEDFRGAVQGEDLDEIYADIERHKSGEPGESEKSGGLSEDSVVTDPKSGKEG